MYSKLFASLIVLASISAHAADSEFFYQSKAGQSDLTPRVGYLTSSTKAKGAGATEVKNTGFMTGVSYEYGLNEMFSVEGSLIYSSVEDDGSPKSKSSGLADPEVALKGTSSMGSSNLRFGLAVGLGLEKSKIEDNGDSNAASGGFSFRPYLGVDTAIGEGSVGARLSYELKAERTMEVSGGTDVKTKDGNELGLSAFYEMAVTDVVFGGALNYTSVEKANRSSGTLTGEVASFNTTSLSLYSRMPFGSWALIPRLDYVFAHSELSKADAVLLSAAARIGF